MRESRSPPPFNEEPQISKDFWGFFVISSRGSFSSPLGFFSASFFFIGIFLHRISRMNRKAILLIGLLTDFRGYLAAGQWLAPERISYCFLSRRFGFPFGRRFPIRRWRRFFSLIILVPQISRIPTDFLLFPVISSFFLYFLYFADFWPVGLGFRRFLWTLFPPYCSLW